MKKTAVKVKVGERKLAGNLYTTEAKQAGGVLFVHGYGDSKNTYAEYAGEITAKAGATCLTVDLSGHGKDRRKRDDFTINDHLADLRASYDLLADSTESTARIRLTGGSFGGFLGILLSEDTDRPLTGLLLQAPAIYPDGLEDVPRKDYDMDAIDEFRRNLSPPPANRALQAIAAFAGPIVLVQSEFDTDIPPNVIDAYAAAAREPTTVQIRGAGHELRPGPERSIFKQVAVNFAGTS